MAEPDSNGLVPGIHRLQHSRMRGGWIGYHDQSTLRHALSRRDRQYRAPGLGTPRRCERRVHQAVRPQCGSFSRNATKIFDAKAGEDHEALARACSINLILNAKSRLGRPLRDLAVSRRTVVDARNKSIVVRFGFGVPTLFPSCPDLVRASLSRLPPGCRMDARNKSGHDGGRRSGMTDRGRSGMTRGRGEDTALPNSRPGPNRLCPNG